MKIEEHYKSPWLVLESDDFPDVISAQLIRNSFDHRQFMSMSEEPRVSVGGVGETALVCRPLSNRVDPSVWLDPEVWRFAVEGFIAFSGQFTTERPLQLLVTSHDSDPRFGSILVTPVTIDSTPSPQKSPLVYCLQPDGHLWVGCPETSFFDLGFLDPYAAQKKAVETMMSQFVTVGGNLIYQP